MNVKIGKGKTKYGPGVDIELSGAEVATAINAYLVAHNVHICGPRTITVNGELCQQGRIYVDPSGFVISDGEKFDGGENAAKISANNGLKDHEIAGLVNKLRDDLKPYSVFQCLREVISSTTMKYLESIGKRIDAK